jgi:hypothetical protein
MVGDISESGVDGRAEDISGELCDIDGDDMNCGRWLIDLDGLGEPRNFARRRSSRRLGGAGGRVCAVGPPKWAPTLEAGDCSASVFRFTFVAGEYRAETPLENGHGENGFTFTFWRFRKGCFGLCWYDRERAPSCTPSAWKSPLSHSLVGRAMS